MHANQGFYKSEKVNELIFESPPYLTVPHSSHSALTVLPFNHNQDGKFFVPWNRHQPTIHCISMTKALTLINQNPNILQILSVTLNVARTDKATQTVFS